MGRHYVPTTTPSFMRRFELIIATLLVPLDYLMLLAAAWTAYRIRFDQSVTGIRQAVYTLPADEYFQIVAISSFLMLVIFAWIGLYAITGTRRILDEFKKIFLACSAAVLIIIVIFFFNRELFSSRFIILIGWVLSMTYVAAMRFIVIIVERYLFRKGIGVHRVLLIGKHHAADALAKAISGSSALGMQITERMDSLDQDVLNRLPSIVKEKQIHEIIVADPTLTRLQTSLLIEFSKTHHVDFKYAADIYDAQVTHVAMRPIAGIPIVEIRRTPLQGWGRILKRLLDTLISLLAIIITGPVMLITALAIKLDSPGPIIYRNRRVGENGKEFDTLKFRSMKIEYSTGDQNPDNQAALELEEQLIKEKSTKEGPVYKIKDDPRVTRVGQFIRSTSIDEFPQFFNVLKGNMSMVGPRPHQPREVEKYMDHQRTVLNIKPGITGLSQISGRSDLAFDEEVRLDKYYIERWSILLDVYIMIKTPIALFKRRQAL